MVAPTLLQNMFYKRILKAVQGWRFLKTKHAWIYWKRPLFQVLTSLYTRTYSNSKSFIVFFFIGVLCIRLTQPSVMFCSDFIISINPLDILTLLMYDNFPIQKMNKLRTSQSKKKLWKFNVCLEISSSQKSYYSETKTSQLIDTSNELTGFYMTRVFTEWWFRTDYKNTQTQAKSTCLF